MRNILIVATYFPPMGGVGVVRVTKYVKYLSQYKWNPTVVTMDKKHFLNYDDTLLKDIKNINIKEIDFKPRKKDISKDFYKALKKQINTIINEKKYDAVFITGGPFFILPIGIYIYKKYKIPYIIDLRDPWKLQRINNSTKIIEIKSKIKRKIVGVLESKTLKKAHAICTINDTMTEEYKKEYPKLKDKIYTISNGFDSDDYKDIEPKKFSKYTIVYTGKFKVSAGFRDPKELFKAIYNLNKQGYEIEFVHVGKKEEEIINLAKEYDIISHCTFTGLKSYKEAIEYCKGANLLLVIGGKEKSEQTGKIFDYIGCQKQILAITTGNSEIDKVCENINIKTIRHGDTKEIEKLIKNLYENKLTKVNDNMNLYDIYNRRELTKQLVNILNTIE